MGSMITEGQAIRQRGMRRYQAHGIDTTTPSQTQGKHIGLRVTDRSIDLRSKNTGLSNFKWKERQGKSGKEHKVIGSDRRTPGVKYESDWHSSQDRAYQSASHMQRLAKAKLE